MHIYGLSLLLNEGFTIDCCVIGNLLRPSFSAQTKYYIGEVVEGATPLFAPPIDLNEDSETPQARISIPSPVPRRDSSRESRCFGSETREPGISAHYPGELV